MGEMFRGMQKVNKPNGENLGIVSDSQGVARAGDLNAQLEVRMNTNKSNVEQIFDLDNDPITELEAEKKAPELTLELGDVTLRKWGPFVHFSNGTDETGMEQIVLGDLGSILGFFNGLFAIVDDRDHFDILKDGLHTYKVEKASFHRNIGYKLNTWNSDGLTMGRWTTLTFDGRVHRLGEQIKPVPYAATQGWSEAARESNRMAHNIESKHYGIDYALRVIAGTAVVKFSLFDVFTTKRGLVEEKILLFGQSKEARQANSKERGDAKQFADGVSAIRNFAATRAEGGKAVELRPEVAGALINIMLENGERENVALGALVGKTFIVVREGGVRTLSRKTPGSIEEAAGVLSEMVRIYGANAYLQETSA